MSRSLAPLWTWYRRFSFAFLLATGLFAPPAEGQFVPPSKSAPHDGYWDCFLSFYEGDFRTAGELFQEAAKNGSLNISLTVPGPWVDAICYHAMIGECHYQMGNLPKALDEYTVALKYFLAHRDWMLRLDLPPAIEPETNPKTPPTWGRSSRATVLGRYQQRYPILTGRISNQEAVTKGGVVAPGVFMPVYVSEIVRCTALSLTRRRELMGPLSEHDPLTAQLVDGLARLPAPPNHWSQCWVQLKLGLAYAAANRIPQAVSELQKSLLAAGQFDHPLTCMAMLELGKLAFEQGKYDAAMKYSHEATISGAYFERYEVLEEAFRLAADSHLLAGQKGVYAPLAPAMASQSKVRMLHASLLTLMADHCVTRGDLPGASRTLSEARNNIGRREMAGGAIGSRLNYQTARAALHAGELKPGITGLTSALTYQKLGSKRLFQIGLVDAAFRGGNLSERIADLLFQDVLREPTRTDWTTNPLDTLAVLTTPHPLPYEHWFELALARKEPEKALNIAERIRRHRFLLTQSLGGRLLALRWVLEGPEEALNKDAVLQRQEMLVGFPMFAELSRRSAELRTKLQELPLAPADEAQTRQLNEAFAELTRVATAQEAMLHVMALERVPCDIAFPPLRDTKVIQEDLPDGTIVFYYFATSRHMHAFALGKDRYAYFTMPQNTKVRADISELLLLMGNRERTQGALIDDLKANGWRPAAARLLPQLTNDAKGDEWRSFRELVIVPDGILWYLPFEALPNPLDYGGTPLLMQLPIRYAPTLALALPDGRAKKPAARTVIAAGRLLPREDDSLTNAVVEPIAAIADATLLHREPSVPTSVFMSTVDRLVVLADCDSSEKAPLSMSPFVLDAGKPGSTLADWSQLPLAGVDQVLLPGFHTSAEFGLKRGGTGDEMFLTVCGLMATGCRTVLLSRWRVGGQSTSDLMREFLQELPYRPAASAWRRSVQLTSDRWLDPALEGRIRSARAGESLKADHPFFWSGYMVVDRGEKEKQAARD